MIFSILLVTSLTASPHPDETEWLERLEFPCLAGFGAEFSFDDERFGLRFERFELGFPEDPEEMIRDAEERIKAGEPPARLLHQAVMGFLLLEDMEKATEASWACHQSYEQEIDATPDDFELRMYFAMFLRLGGGGCWNQRLYEEMQRQFMAAAEVAPHDSRPGVECAVAQHERWTFGNSRGGVDKKWVELGILGAEQAIEANPKAAGGHWWRCRLRVVRDFAMLDESPEVRYQLAMEAVDELIEGCDQIEDAGRIRFAAHYFGVASWLLTMEELDSDLPEVPETVWPHAERMLEYAPLFVDDAELQLNAGAVYWMAYCLTSDGEGWETALARLEGMGLEQEMVFAVAALLFQAQGREGLAMEFSRRLEEVIESDWWRRALVIYRYRAGQYAGALEIVRQYEEVTPDTEFQRAVLLLRTGEREGALELLDELAKGRDDDGNLYHALGVARALVGNKNGAVPALEKAIELLEKNNGAKETLSEIFHLERAMIFRILLAALLPVSLLSDEAEWLERLELPRLAEFGAQQELGFEQLGLEVEGFKLDFPEDPEEKIRDAEERLKAGEPPARLLHQAALGYLSLNDAENALGALTACLRSYEQELAATPDDFELRMYFAKALGHTGRACWNQPAYEEMQRQFLAAAEIAPDDSRPGIECAVAQLGRWTFGNSRGGADRAWLVQGILGAEQAIEANPKAAGGHWWRFTLRMAHDFSTVDGPLEVRIRVLEEIVDELIEGCEQIEGAGRIRFAAHYYGVMVWLSTMQNLENELPEVPEAVWAHAERMVEFAPLFADSADLLSSAAFIYWMAYCQTQDGEDWEETLARLENLGFEREVALGVAVCCFQEKGLEGLAAEVARRIEETTEGGLGRRCLVAYRYRTGQYAGALEIVRHYEDVTPDTEIQRAVLLLRTGEREEALELLEELAKDRDDEGNLYHALGVARALAGDKGGAVTALEKAIELLETNNGAKETLSEIRVPRSVLGGATGQQRETNESTQAASEEMRVPSWAKAKPGTTMDSATRLPREITDLATGVELVLIPAGEYWRGASSNDDLASVLEKPRHIVRITSPFYLGKYEVTNRQYEAFVSDHDSGDYKGAGSLDGDTQPAVRLSWIEAQAFCTNFGFRLPTEAEWEYACRAGSTTRFPWGDDPNAGLGWANITGPGTAEDQDMGHAFSFDDGFSHSSPVGSLRANAFGLHDMIGNVWEWCADWVARKGYDDYPDGIADPQGPESGMGRSLRGGSWASSGPRLSRSSTRFLCPPEAKSYHYGFRVARTPSLPPSLGERQ